MKNCPVVGCPYCANRIEIPGVIRKPDPVPERYATVINGVQSESARRKAQPLFQGCFMYFPDALLAVAEHSRKANEKHNPGEPIHWAKEKSKDHADCVGRHILDIGPDWDAIDPEFGSLHAVALAWRALALAQTVLDRQKARMATYRDDVTPAGAR